MKTQMAKLLTASVLLLGIALSTQAAGRVYLGKVSLKDSKDVDVINLAPCKTSSNKAVRSIKLRVKQYPAEIDRLSVKFQNGAKQVLYVRDHFRVGQSSRWIDLHGKKRCIKKIIVFGDTDSRGRDNSKQAKVLFFGK